jgi:lysophospholipase L1-like esterase
MPEMVKTNALIETFLRDQKRADFINIYDVMLDAQGNPRKELFTEDNLHMNANGYAIWQQKIAPYLKKTRKPKRTTQPSGPKA